MISVDTKDMPEFFRTPEFEGRSMMCKKLEMLPLECIVRGYITGSGWASYQKTGLVCGIKLPEGLKESDKLPEPIYTPSTKAEIGDHDENISYERSIAHLEKFFFSKKFLGHHNGFLSNLVGSNQLISRIQSFALRCRQAGVQKTPG
jgi:phosphoribosylaminoimidazole-succinocarboxamide synthase